MFIHIVADVLSTCQNLKGSEFNVPVSETASLGTNFMSSFFKERIGSPKSYGFIRGCSISRK